MDFDTNPAVDPATIHTLARGDSIRKADPLCLISDSGTGKSHLLIEAGTAAAQQGFRVRYALVTEPSWAPAGKHDCEWVQDLVIPHDHRGEPGRVLPHHPTTMPQMLSRDGGHIVNISTSLVDRADSNDPPRCRPSPKVGSSR